MLNIPQAFAEALQYHRQGNLAEAERLYLQILSVDPSHADALHLLGTLAFQLGRSDAAVAYLRQSLALQPANANAHSDLGLMLMQQGQGEQALGHLQQALRLRPGHPEATLNLGNLLTERGELDRAADCYRQLLRLHPDHLEALINLANTLVRQSHPAEAIPLYRQAIYLRSDHAQAYNGMGYALEALGQLEEAGENYRRCLALQPGHLAALLNLANVFRKLGQRDDAIAVLQQALSIQRGHADAHNTLGVLLQDGGRLDEAVLHHRQAVQLDPRCVEAYTNLGNVLVKRDQWDEARACYQAALQLQPGHPDGCNGMGNVLRVREGKVEEAVLFYQQCLQRSPHHVPALVNLGIVRQVQERLEESAAHYRQALQVDPACGEAHLGLAQLALLQGDFAQGWSEYEWRWQTQDFPPHPHRQPLWDGASLEGRVILLHAEQGLGDTLQFVRYVPLVKQRGGTVLFQCQPSLQRLLATVRGCDRLFVRGEPLPLCDVQAPLMSLPGILETTLDSIPAEVPYLFPAIELFAQWREELDVGEVLTIGLAWQGNPRNRQDRWRSLPLAQLVSLGQLEGVRLISLQQGSGSEQLSQVASQLTMDDLGGRMNAPEWDFLDTAAVVANLDLVITVDSAVAHLAGALGVPTWVLVPKPCDWRWLMGREDSPWYPGMRLFRQSERGQWTDVIDRLLKALQQRLRCGLAKPR
jgi:tetratricopeptide (TPR) repeat protein